MGSHPLNLALRFLLEISSLLAIGFWGWDQSDSWLKYLLALGLPIFAAAVWGIFNVPGDPSRSGKAPVKTPGIIRLLIELFIFFIASWALFCIDRKTFGLVMGIATIIHYLFSIDRIKWLINSK